MKEGVVAGEDEVDHTEEEQQGVSSQPGKEQGFRARAPQNRFAVATVV